MLNLVYLFGAQSTLAPKQAPDLPPYLHKEIERVKKLLENEGFVLKESQKPLSYRLDFPFRRKVRKIAEAFTNEIETLFIESSFSSSWKCLGGGLKITFSPCFRDTYDENTLKAIVKLQEHLQLKQDCPLQKKAALAYSSSDNCFKISFGKTLLPRLVMIEVDHLFQNAEWKPLLRSEEVDYCTFFSLVKLPNRDNR